MIKFLGKVPCESVIDIGGEIAAAEIKSEGVTQRTVELQIRSVFVITRSRPILPF